MTGSTLPLPDVLDATDPVLAHVERFARDVAWRHRNHAADPVRFRAALEGYYRAWRISQAAQEAPLERRVLRAAISAYREAHQSMHPSRRRNERRAA
jgi:hypothetical protein